MKGLKRTAIFAMEIWERDLKFGGRKGRTHRSLNIPLKKTWLITVRPSVLWDLSLNIPEI